MTERGLYRRIHHWDLREEKTAKTTPHLSDRVRQGKKHVCCHPHCLEEVDFFPPSQVCLASPLSLKIPYMFIQGGSLTLLFLLPTQEYVNGNQVTSLSLSSLDFISVPMASQYTDEEFHLVFQVAVTAKPETEEKLPVPPWCSLDIQRSGYKD